MACLIGLRTTKRYGRALGLMTSVSSALLKPQRTRFIGSKGSDTEGGKVRTALVGGACASTEAQQHADMIRIIPRSALCLMIFSFKHPQYAMFPSSVD